MKLCEKCGAQNSDERNFCVDCGERLGKALSPRQEEEYRKIAQEKMEKICNKTDPSHVNGFDKIMGILSMVGVFVTLVRLIFATGEPEPFTPFGWCLVLFLWSGIASVVPGVVWSLRRSRWWDDGCVGPWYNPTRRVAVAISILIGIVLLVFSWFPELMDCFLRWF